MNYHVKESNVVKVVLHLVDCLYLTIVCNFNIVFGSLSIKTSTRRKTKDLANTLKLFYPRITIPLYLKKLEQAQSEETCKEANCYCKTSLFLFSWKTKMSN